MEVEGGGWVVGHGKGGCERHLFDKNVEKKRATKYNVFDDEKKMKNEKNRKPVRM